MHLQVKTLALAVAAVSLLTAFLSPPASATVAIGIELQSGQTTTVTEGNDLTLTFVMTNTDSTTTFVTDGSGTPIFNFISGDGNDIPTGLKNTVTFPAACSNLTPAGSATDTCTFSVTLTTGPADFDGDSGISLFELPISIRPVSGSDSEEDAAAPPITVNDPVGATSVPEPTSLALFASGLLGLGLFARRNRKRG